MIPEFDVHGLVPPIRPGSAGDSNERAPFPTDILTFCRRFGTSVERRRILRGLLELREELRGEFCLEEEGGCFQWLDGSFVEDIEFLQNRAPGDIDVVTFAPLGDQAAQIAILQRRPEFFNPAMSKKMFQVDHYMMATDCELDEVYARRIGYWYSLWSHQRETMRFKGFVSVNLTSNDADARAWLDGQHGQEGGAA